jgi:hypothetical protein
VPETGLYIVGTFDTGVTVFSQQTRALNFAWAAMESGLITAVPHEAQGLSARPLRIGIVGGGFAGLSVAAGLLKKHADASITIFEQRDTLLPLQQGSDSRWLHPRIYDWPSEGSEASVAMLPILNWTAARASDVVVQILAGWKKILDEDAVAKPRLYCNTRHLQVHELSGNSKQLRIEWVGESRSEVDGTAVKSDAVAAVGKAEEFDLVILAVGFGLERDAAKSYWRNETLGQPSLDEPRQTFLVSGQGDGAMIDLLRLRISQFRQDRILDELFRGLPNLVNAIKRLYSAHLQDPHEGQLFAELEALQDNADTKQDFEQVRQTLSRRLRRDSEVILHLKVKKLSELFESATSRISFQNKVLVYFLYKCGGFIPSSLDEHDLLKQYSIPQARKILRHGTLRDEQLKAILSSPLCTAIEGCRGDAESHSLSQTDVQCWPGGYFGYPGTAKDMRQLGDRVRQHWRKEYLPGPMELLATAFCASIAGALKASYADLGRLRVTLHRTLPFGEDELLQQCCNYVGTKDAKDSKSGAARTFPARKATIGLAYRTRQIVRTRRGASRTELQTAMEALDLNAASRQMSQEVGFVLAIPLLEPETPGEFMSPTPVCGVIYIDSTANDFFVEDHELRQLVLMAQEFLGELERAEESPYHRVRNVPLTGRRQAVPPADPMEEGVPPQLELVSDVNPPKTTGPFQLNYEYSEFLPVGQTNR